MLIDNELVAIKNYKDNTQKPYKMGEESRKVTSETYLLVGDQDLLFAIQNSAKNAKEKIKSLKKVAVFENMGQGIETFPYALKKVWEIIVSRDW